MAAERTVRLLTSAAVVIGGAITFGLGDIASALTRTAGYAMGAGTALMLVGGALFVFDWFASWWDGWRGRNPAARGFPVLPVTPAEAEPAGR